MNKMIMTSLSIDELKEVLRDIVKQELNPKKEKELLTFEETREILSLSKSGLNKWKAEGKIPFNRLGKRIYFKREEVLAAVRLAGNYHNLKELEKK